MIYNSDSRTLPARFHPRFDYRRSIRRRHESETKVNVISPLGEVQDSEEQDFSDLQSWFMNFCSNTSVHGVKFIGQTSLHWTERLFWCILVLCAILSIASVSLELSDKFSNSPLSTVVESTIYPVSEIAYPAVTICNRNRFSKERCTEAEAKFLPNADNKTLEMFRLLVSSMNFLEFGALDEFDEEIFTFSSDQLDSLNLTEIFEFAMLTCDEIFTGRCWWRNKYMNCCDDFFYVTRSEYGLCYSFNSAVTDIGREKEVSSFN